MWGANKWTHSMFKKYWLVILVLASLLAIAKIINSKIGISFPLIQGVLNLLRVTLTSIEECPILFCSLVKMPLRLQSRHSNISFNLKFSA